MKISIDKIIKADRETGRLLSTLSSPSEPEAAHNYKFEGYYL
jgi:hypothetical protein